ncbi:acetyl-CoA C-acyltransferase [Thermanaerosceptrum fracticalcis]|jgi:acetyl-CoA C-acetyltransferase|uniref:Acetyl-CoA acetyltransferase n=1 Tax=Thermanaerosceptrum fracticalcis TaxID=1712410 RepID=A0A7G6DYP3_THEFR|nr:thiolase family protein [Thermanaerosceptrum fracticalcis]QNB44947.1 acetyl-CoA C-acyltransferase [Thermanaerosceptrum fracticalcis]
MKRVVIVSAVRTAGGSFGGSFKDLTAVDLGAAVIKEAVKRAGLSPHAVGQVIFGNGWQAGVGPNPARLCTVKGGLPDSCPAFTVNIRCGSSLRAVELGILSIAAGEEDIVLAGGTESSTQVPYILPEARWGQRMGDTKIYDVLHKDGFMCQLAGMLMGNTAELLVEKYKISREEQDSFALESHYKAVDAMEKGLFKEEIVPVEIKDRKGVKLIDTDEIPRKDVSLEKLGKLPPVFLKEGSVTAGNSCALCDAASAVLLMSEEKARELGVKPMALVRSYSYVALDPKYMGLGPVLAIPKALEKAGLKLQDIDLIELNEAFAAQVIACDRELKIDKEKLNVHGGAIALGHPVGATGAKILTTLLYALKNRDKHLGIVSLCIGGGQGVALVVERLN